MLADKWKALYPRLGLQEAKDWVKAMADAGWAMLAQCPSRKAADKLCCIRVHVEKGSSGLGVVGIRVMASPDFVANCAAENSWNLRLEITRKGVPQASWNFGLPLLGALGWTDWGRIPRNADGSQTVVPVPIAEGEEEMGIADGKCMSCRQPAGPTGLLRCSGCKLAFYCNKECQLSHWRAHKPTCKATASIAAQAMAQAAAAQAPSQAAAAGTSQG